ncbi:MAG: CHAP domain-containing protein [Nitrososphaera sp.]|nr:CHAP domain-containing protein [Nitrososphaera sp.]
MQKRLIWLLMFASSFAYAAENPSDTYDHATECPQNGPSYATNGTGDVNAFIRCQCTSYVAEKLSDLFTARWWNNQLPDIIPKAFHNTRYYMPIGDPCPNPRDPARWSDARCWQNIALKAGIGVTGARDNFHWDEDSYNAVFVGDVAWWNKWTGNAAGHVAIVEAVEQDTPGRGVACVTVSDYNMTAYDYRRIRLCKNDTSVRFPDAFLHIDQDHAWCSQHPDKCPGFVPGGSASSGTRGDGIGGGSDHFNLKLDFDILDSISGNEWMAGSNALAVGQTLKLNVEVEAEDGDTEDHMQDGKDKIEVDFYVQQGLNDWALLGREYVKESNLENGETNTETLLYVVPDTNGQELSFKVKIDAEDEAMEAHEGDNWSRIETFTVNPAVNPGNPTQSGNSLILRLLEMDAL